MGRLKNINIDSDGNFFNNANVVECQDFFDSLEAYSNDNNQLMYVISRPLSEKKYQYDINNPCVVLIPGNRIIFLNIDGDERFEDFILDFLEDLSSIADKYNHISVLGRSRRWREELCFEGNISNDVEELINDSKCNNSEEVRKCNLLISLIIGSINDIARIGANISDNLLDQIKQRIILFDAKQTKFIFNEIDRKIIRIQGLSGTGKTELLLHKLKEIFLHEEGKRIALTCHNKVLASSLRKRIPDFFNFMKVEQQIKWNETLFCFHAWGSSGDINSGFYRYLCYFYQIPFEYYSRNNSFRSVCQKAINFLKENNDLNGKFAFDYLFIDESQDFPQEFFELCDLVVRDKIFIAGDVFQSIFDDNITTSYTPDFLLNKCYRTHTQTLMLAHSLGMGLLEPKKLRWLNQEEWQACGYIYEELRKDNKCCLARTPISRLDTENKFTPFLLDIDDCSEINILRYIHKTISQIRSDNDTVQPEDIAIIFPNGNMIYETATSIENMLWDDFEYKTNKSYETKCSHTKGEVFLANRNNVKGLEFPFVIIIITGMSEKLSQNNITNRNAMYMAITRSFIQSYILIDNNNYVKSIASILNQNIKPIISSEIILTELPHEDEIKVLDEKLKELQLNENLTLEDTMELIYSELKVTDEEIEQLDKILLVLIKKKNWDEKLIRGIIMAQLEIIREM